MQLYEFVFDLIVKKKKRIISAKNIRQTYF